MAYTLRKNPALAHGIMIGLGENWCYEAVNTKGQVCARFGKPIPAVRPGLCEGAYQQGLAWVAEQQDKQA